MEETDEELKVGTLYAMRRVLGKTFDVPESTKVIHSKWCTNRNFRGTYPYETIDSVKIDALDVLQQPLVSSEGTQRVMFAGDSMIKKRYSAVDGAIASGFREDDRLVQLLSGQ